MIKVKLVFNKLLTSLAGNQYGVSEFDKQIKNVDYNSEYTIVFPEQIKYIATSFIQGFFKEFVETIGIAGIEQKITIESSINNLKQIVIDSLV